MKKLLPKVKLHGYELRKRIGVGGDGEVWLVSNEAGEQFALKARPASENNASFQREFERLRMMHLPSIIKVHEAGIDNGYVYYTMDVAEGVDFTSYVQLGANLKQKISRCIKASKPIAQALAAMHRADLVHLDLKPDNIIVNHNGKSILLDFGRACALGDRQLHQGMLGTMRYMAPEQRIDIATDHRADSYALGLCMYESLSGVPLRPGLTRPSLLLQHKGMNAALASLIEQMLQFDPLTRPSAESIYRVLLSIEKNIRMSPSPWPAPTTYIGDAKPLLHRSLIVCGPRGSGCKRMVQEARRLWFHQGYRSVAGECLAGQPHHALQSILKALFAPLSPKQKRRLIGQDGAILRAIAPRLPLPTDDRLPLPIDAKRVARVLAKVLKSLSPIAIIFWEIQLADPHTKQIMGYLCQDIPPRVKIWCTSRQEVSWLPCISPPKWTVEEHEKLCKQLLPPKSTSPTTIGTSPLESCILVWETLATWQGLQPPQLSQVQRLGSLGILPQPFPHCVGDILCKDLEKLVKDGLLQVTARSKDDERWYRIADHGMMMLLQAQTDNPRNHRLAAQAWQRFHEPQLRHEMIAFHRIYAGDPPHRHLIVAIEYAIQREANRKIEQWLRYLDTIGLKTTPFIVDYARMLIDVYFYGGTTLPDHFSRLLQQAQKPKLEIMVRFLQVVHYVRHGEGEKGIELGEQLYPLAAATIPRISVEIYRLLALAKLHLGRPKDAVEYCYEARELILRSQNNVTQEEYEHLQNRELSLGTTHSASLIYAQRYQEACKLCEENEQMARTLQDHEGRSYTLINWAIALYQMGHRKKAKDISIRCRRLIDRYDEPPVHQWCALLEGQLAIERGEVNAGLQKLEESLSLGLQSKNKNLLAQIWTNILEAAVVQASPREAARAIRAYRNLNTTTNDAHWAAAESRWHWLAGDLPRALACVKDPQPGYAGSRIKAEYCRFLLISGNLEHAALEAKNLYHQAENLEMLEISLFSRLILGAANKITDNEYNTILVHCRSSEWNELYLGSLHLDAIRRRMRGQKIKTVLQELRERSRALSNRLYEALAQEELW